MIPFSPPHIDREIIEEVTDALMSGWITTGKRTKLFEKKIANYCFVSEVLCLNSATAGLELMLRWFGVGAGDEVILPAYTYCATANVIIHVGATPVFVDVCDDFNISIYKIQEAITTKTKVIMPVDIGGLPCEYDLINFLVSTVKNREMFYPANENQEKLGRILVLADAAHSLGATYHGDRTGGLTDATVFSFHAVKNLTTAEGGALCLDLPAPFDNAEIYKELCIKSLHGQTRDALTKSQAGNWKYDVVEAGYKCNMTDIHAAIGLAQIDRYQKTLEKRKQIFEIYCDTLSGYDWAEIPKYFNYKHMTVSSFHAYMLRIKGITEEQRDRIMEEIFASGISVNVHFLPVPMLTFYKNMGYDIKDYPVAYDNYSREISLPVYFDLSIDNAVLVAEAVIKAVEKTIKIL